MDAEGSCVMQEQLVDEDDELSVKLAAATYQVYAVGGATSDDYQLPTMEDATGNSEIKLKDNALHGDLMTAQNTITLSENEDRMLALSMSRKVMKVNVVEIKDIPTTVSHVAIAIEPLYKGLMLNGTYVAGTEVAYIDLVKQDDGTTWKNATPQNLLPASGGATISVKLTTDGETKSVSYTSPTALEANHMVDITGIYKPASKELVTLNGTITGATWDETVSIRFSFDETSSQTEEDDSDEPNNGGSNGDGVEPGTAPAVLSSYKESGIVIKSDDDDTGTYTIVTIIHKNEELMNAASMTEEELDAQIESLLPSFDVNGVTGWRLPTEAEARAISRNGVSNRVEAIGGTRMGQDFYFLKENGHIKAFSTGSFGLPYSNGQALRPVTTLKFRK